MSRYKGNAIIKYIYREILDTNELSYYYKNMNDDSFILVLFFQKINQVDWLIPAAGKEFTPACCSRNQCPVYSERREPHEKNKA
ncbi:hypothetical protein [Cytobacillus sp. FSL H8-0458]|uniref:hypothetical protein n=1 Tax=Cytobacillus sp. FSL H8-0458 TaxID=2975346 RepID=UPI0030F723FF